MLKVYLCQEGIYYLAIQLKFADNKGCHIEPKPMFLNHLKQNNIHSIIYIILTNE